jgi:hypothetical protein
LTSPANSDDLLDRLFQRLVANLAALDPAALHRPVPVVDIYERLVPYRTHRVVLGCDTGEDYDLTVLRLLAGEGGYASTFPEEVRAALAAELLSVNPDIGLFRQFHDATMLLSPDYVTAVLNGPGPAEPGAELVEATPLAEDEADLAPASEPEPDAGEATATQLPFTLDEPADSESRPLTRPREVAPVSAPCPYCGDQLPVGRAVLFCPHCGQNVGVVHCPTCGTELDVGWLFCITCGQKVTGLG